MSQPEVSVAEVTPEELHELMQRDGPRAFRLVDCREEEEFRICRLDWAELIPLGRLHTEAEERLIDKDRPIVVYCHHGLRSHYACGLLREIGYQHVYNLVGGIDAWAERIDTEMERY